MTFAGMEILPIMEKSERGWLAWRLRTEDDTPSGYQPPLPGRVGKSNVRGTPLSDRSRGIWQKVGIAPQANEVG